MVALLKQSDSNAISPKVSQQLRAVQAKIEQQQSDLAAASAERRMAVGRIDIEEPDGAARIEFLDAEGKVTKIIGSEPE